MIAAAGVESERRREIARLLAIALLAAAVVLLYLDTYASMARVWTSSEYRHGILMFPVSGYLLWRLRRPLAAVDVRPCAWGVGILVALVLVWHVARAVGVQVVEHFAAVMMIPAAVLALLGWPLVRLAMFPLLFLAAAVPVGDGFVPYLMEITADLSSAMLRAAGAPVYREGQFISLPGGNFVVADVCAGLSYLTAGTIIALLFGYFTYDSNWKRAAFTAAAAVAMILFNGVRAFIVMFVASATDMQYLAGRDHVYFGWVLFGLVVVGLVYAGSLLADRGPRADAGRAMREDAWGRAEARHRVRVGESARPIAQTLVVVASVGVLAAGPLASTGAPVESGAAAPALPDLDGCGPARGWSAPWQPMLVSPDAVVAAGYDCADGPVGVFVGVYAGGTDEGELVSSDNVLMPGIARQPIPVVRSFAAADGRKIAVNEVESTSGEHELVWYWYEIGRRTATSAAGAKLAQAVSLIVDRRSDGKLWLLRTPVIDSVDASRARLEHAAGALSAAAARSRDGT